VTKDSRFTIQDCLFTWDPDKAASNAVKHGVRFEEACEVFFDPLHEMEEDAAAQGEQRWVILGYSKSDRPLCVAAVEREDSWRIISARKTTPEERRRHEEDNDTV
jgi:uncharacterized protein